MLVLPNLIEINGSHYRIEKPQDELFKSVCEINGHLFIADNDPIPVPEENLLKKCFVCDSYITFWYYSSEMVDAIKSKGLCC